MKLKISSNRYKYARINAGYSQVDVINILGFPTKAALSNYEKDLSLPSNRIIYALSSLYGVSLEQETINILKNIKNSNQSLHDFETYLLKLKEECLHVNY